MVERISSSSETRHSILTRRLRTAGQSPLRPERHRVGTSPEVETFVVDIEVTNRCNATCNFCPRAKTPHQGLMTVDVFEQVLARAIEFREVVEEMSAGSLDLSFCGLGEAVLHPDLPTFMRQATDAGFKPCMCSNGSLIDEALARTLLDAGLSDVFFNVSSLPDDYDSTYGLSFDRTRSNVERFIEMSGDACNVWIVLVDHKMDQDYVREVQKYWQERGVRAFYPSPMLNRAGTIEHDVLDFDHHPMEQHARARFGDELPGCSAPAQCLTIGYDGIHYICNSDWEKKQPAGSVFDLSILEAMEIKLAMARDRENSICRLCNHDPLNQISRLLADESHAVEIDDAIDMLYAKHDAATTFVERAIEGGHFTSRARRALIPVTAAPVGSAPTTQ